jgi:hypothetical protein
MNRTVAGVGLACIAVVAQGACVAFPRDGQQLEAYNEPVTFVGFAYYPKSTVTIRVLNHGKHVWEVIGTAVSSEKATPLFGESMYQWQTTIPIADSTDVGAAACRWYADCGVDPYHPRFAKATVKVAEVASFPLVAFDDATWACFADSVKARGVAGAYARCRHTERGADLIHLYLK